MALATVEITPESWRTIERIGRAADGWLAATGRALGAAVGVGGDAVAEWMMLGELGLRPGNAGAGGLASGVRGWMLSGEAGDEPMGAIGVPGNHPAAAYAGIHETGGTIYPRNARALAIPVSDEARLHASPREMDGLSMIKRPGKTPILARTVGETLEVHWVLVPSVTIEATHWLSTGVQRAAPEMARVMLMELEQFLNAA